MLAVCLLQTIGLFHETREERVQSNMYHAMLVMVRPFVTTVSIIDLTYITQMIRQSGMLEANFNWEPQPLTDQASSEAAWRDWVCYETSKRCVYQA